MVGLVWLCWLLLTWWFGVLVVCVLGFFGLLVVVCALCLIVVRLFWWFWNSRWISWVVVSGFCCDLLF